MEVALEASSARSRPDAENAHVIATPSIGCLIVECFENKLCIAIADINPSLIIAEMNSPIGSYRLLPFAVNGDVYNQPFS